MTKPRHIKKVYQRNSALTRGKRFFHIGLFVFLLFFVGLASLFLYYAKDLPRPERLGEVALAKPSKIYDRTGEVLLYELYGEEKREFVPLPGIPRELKLAVLATEDQHFYSHFGLDWRGVGRAILINLKLRAPVQGGSTITQQLVRSTLLSREKTVARKVKELILTLELELRYPKDQILEFYINQIPLGSNIYGVGAASQFYFGKKPNELSLAESGVLAALIKAPSYYSPYGSHKEELMSRKDYVLSRMVRSSYITQDQATEAKAQVLEFRDPGLTIKAPHFPSIKSI